MKRLRPIYYFKVTNRSNTYNVKNLKIEENDDLKYKFSWQHQKILQQKVSWNGKWIENLNIIEKENQYLSRIL